jgi:hypothetical protein
MRWLWVYPFRWVFLTVHTPGLTLDYFRSKHRMEMMFLQLNFFNRQNAGVSYYGESLPARPDMSFGWRIFYFACGSRP